MATMLMNCVLWCSHNLNTWKRSWQIKTPRSGVIWKYLLMCAAWQESRINPSFRHRDYFFSVRHWRWLILQLQKDPSCRLEFYAHSAQCTLGLGSRVTLALMGFPDLAGLLWGHSISGTFLFHPQSWPTALISDFNLDWKFGIVKMLESSYISHQIVNLFPQNEKLLAIPYPGMSEELCQEAKNVKACREQLA